MGREDKIRVLKTAWIDEQNRIVTFTSRPASSEYSAEEPDFWPHILDLMHSGYRVG